MFEIQTIAIFVHDWVMFAFHRLPVGSEPGDGTAETPFRPFNRLDYQRALVIDSMAYTFDLSRG
jgi:hypothetical protein